WPAPRACGSSPRAPAPVPSTARPSRTRPAPQPTRPRTRRPGGRSRRARSTAAARRPAAAEAAADPGPGPGPEAVASPVEAGAVPRSPPPSVPTEQPTTPRKALTPLLAAVRAVLGRRGRAAAPRALEGHRRARAAVPGPVGARARQGALARA